MRMFSGTLCVSCTLTAAQRVGQISYATLLVRPPYITPERSALVFLLLFKSFANCSQLFQSYAKVAVIDLDSHTAMDQR